MQQDNRSYISIDLKSFFASVECADRGLNPITTNLVVADVSRTEKTICLAVSPSLKAYGISGRARLFEVVQRVKEVNADRLYRTKRRSFEGSSYNSEELAKHPEYELEYIAAPPRMSAYMKYSTDIYNIYLRYIAPEDIHVYSIDEVFIDAAQYMRMYGLSARELAAKLINEVFEETGITATAGIGTNMYLCKVAMDIMAKHAKPDSNGVRIAELDEMSYRRELWSHKPITDFWRVGSGYAKKLAAKGIYTMGDVARCSVGKQTDYYNENLLYKLFGINAELLIDHAWGWEPCTIADIKSYKPQSNSISSGQVLQCPYDYAKTKLIVKEMTELLVLDLVEKNLVTNQLVLTIGYDIESLSNPDIASRYKGEVTLDRYGRRTPKHAHGTANTDKYTSSTRIIMDAVLNLYERIINPDLLVRRINVTANRIIDIKNIPKNSSYEQLDIFTDFEEKQRKEEAEKAEIEKERRIQLAELAIKKKFGKNAILKGTNLEEGATTIERNNQIGGHKA